MYIYLVALISIISAMYVGFYGGYWHIFPFFIILLAPTIVSLIIRRHSLNKVGKRTEYLGNYGLRAVYYEPWNELVIEYVTVQEYCGRDSNGYPIYRSVQKEIKKIVYHPEKYVMETKLNIDHYIGKSEYQRYVKIWGNENFFYVFHNYYDLNGGAYYTNWNMKEESYVGYVETKKYINKTLNSNSIYKFSIISFEDFNNYKLYLPVKYSDYHQIPLFGFKTDYKNNDLVVIKRFEFINAYFGCNYKFRVTILFYYNQPVKASELQRMDSKNGEKNELTICLGLKKGQDCYIVNWCNCFSWCDKPIVESYLREWFVKNNVLDMMKFSDYLVSVMKKYWHQKDFRDFDYLKEEVATPIIIWTIVCTILFCLLIGVLNIFLFPYILENFIYAYL